jgi:hypothetical protein
MEARRITVQSSPFGQSAGNKELAKRVRFYECANPTRTALPPRAQATTWFEMQTTVGKLEKRTTLICGEVQRRNAFVACSTFRIEGLEASLNRAREIAVRDQLHAVERYIEEAQNYLTQIRVLHQEALEEFTEAQGE